MSFSIHTSVSRLSLETISITTHIEPLSQWPHQTSYWDWALRQFLHYDNKHRAVEFSVGEEVYLKLHDGYHLPGKPSKKFSQQRAGPWRVKRRVGRLAYELDLPETFKIHPVVSVAQLVPMTPGEDPFHRRIPPPGPVEADQGQEQSNDIYETEIVLQHRPNRAKNGFDYLVKWKGYGHEDNMWMGEKQLHNSSELVDEYWARRGGREPTPTKGNTDMPVKRGPGRPRKEAKGSTDAITPAKRGRGRPRKEVVLKALGE